MDRAEMVRSLRGGEIAWGARNKIADELERLGRIEAEHQGCTENMASLVRERDEAERARDEALVERDAAHQVLDELRRRATRRMVELRDTGIDMSGRPDAFCEGIRKSGRSLIGWLDELDPRKQEGKL